MKIYGRLSSLIEVTVNVVVRRLWFVQRIKIQTKSIDKRLMAPKKVLWFEPLINCGLRAKPTAGINE